LLFRGIRGGGFLDIAFNEGAAIRLNMGAGTDGPNVGFRLAMVPEPGTGLLVMMGMLGLARWRRHNT
jgi:hypothetical protein